MKSPQRHKQVSGFTIVELLIVIVVIGVLAAVVIVAYSGIQERARASAASSALTQAAKKIALWQIDNPGSVPTSLSDAGVTSSGSASYQYSQTNSGTGYCITATVGTTSYYLNSTTQTTPISGGCAGHGVGGVGAITNLATNPSAETNAGWYSNNGATHATSYDTSISRSGAKSLESHNLGSDSTLMSIYGAGGLTGNGFAVGSNKTYTVSAYGRATVPYKVRLFYAFRTNGVWTSAVYGSWTSGTAGTWTQASFTATSAANTDLLRVCIQVSADTTQPAGTSSWADDLMAAESNSVYNYADGNSPGWIWNGTPHNSTSTGSPL